MSHDTEKELRNQIEKWRKKLEEELEENELKGESEEVQELYKNIEAYFKDSKHFKDKKDLVRSFEALVWSWAIFDTLKKLEKVGEK